MGFDDEPRTPGLENLLDAYGDAMRAKLQTALPAKIVDYDEDKQRASVQVMVKNAYIDPNGNRVVESFPIIHDVPVTFEGAGAARTTYPVRVGDLCMAWFCSRSIQRLIVTGRHDDPGNDDRHDLNDAVARVGFHTFDDPPTEAPTDAVVMWPGDFEVRIGGYAGAEKTIKGETYRSAEDNYFAALEAIIGTILAAPPLATYLASGAPAASAAAWTAAITVFHAAASTYLAEKAKVV